MTIIHHGERYSSSNPGELEDGTKEEGGEGQGGESPGQGKAPPGQTRASLTSLQGKSYTIFQLVVAHRLHGIRKALKIEEDTNPEGRAMPKAARGSSRWSVERL